jgi:hypothetical protein
MIADCSILDSSWVEILDSSLSSGKNFLKTAAFASLDLELGLVLG